MELDAGVKTDRGRRRPNNEDAFFADSRNGIFVIADGMGGHQAGEVASRIAVETIRGHLLGNKDSLDLGTLREAVERANRNILDRSRDNAALDHMGTTVVVATVRNRRLLLAHVGDSRAYRLTDNGLQQLTDDHSLVFQWLKAGRISEEEARHHPQRAGLLRALGMEPKVEIDLREEAYGGEWLLLCTDGLTDMLRDGEIENVLNAGGDPQQLCELLVARANEAGGRDNITVMLVRGRR